MILPGGYTARPATRDDAPAVAALITACQAADGQPAPMTAGEIIDEWAGLDLDEDTVLVFDPAGDLAASADFVNRRFVQGSIYGNVHPDHRGLGLGGALVRWGEAWLHRHMDRAPAGARVVAQGYIRASNETARQLMAAHGYRHVRTIFVMETTLEAPLQSPNPPPGTVLRPFVPGRDERATFDAIEDAFRDTWERPPGLFERWLSLTEPERRHPDLWVLAADRASGAIVGASLGKLTGERGWIGTVAVRRPWRGHGLGLTLLHETFAAFYHRGVRHVSLSVDADSLTGAPRLYRRAGMRVAEEYLLHRKVLRPGALLLADNDLETTSGLG
jgi:mycothiol synthase